MRILIVSPELPYPPAWGFAIRVFTVMSLLARHHEVSLLTYARDGDEDKIRALESMCHRVHTVRERSDGSLEKRLRQSASLFSSRS